MSVVTQRRRLLLACGVASFATVTRTVMADVRPPDAGVTHAYREALQRGGTLVLVRHAMTHSGVGDPPGFRIDDCSTQRNLSDDGRAQSRRFGRWFHDQRLMPTRVRSSQWCRCLDTAAEAFSKENIGRAITVEPWLPLNSFFQGHGYRDQQLQHAMAEARGLAMRGRDAGFEVWVTHQVTISALTNQYLGMGEMVVAIYDGPGKPLKVLASGLRF